MKHLHKFHMLLLLIFVGSTLFAQSSIERIEPPNWWIGMQNPELQILLYGKNIAEMKAKTAYPGVTVMKSISTKNPNYLFIYLIIGAEALPGTMDIQLLDQQENAAASFQFELRPREKGAALREGFDPSDVMYLITPDRFANGNPENDDIKGMADKSDRSHKLGRHGGDLKGINENLDYIKEMGFTAIWLNPVLENDMPRMSYHGYATTDFYKVDERFGTNEEYKELCSKAARKGIKVIMDMILNHCGSEHWFVLDPPTDDWINFDGKYVRTNHRRNTIQDIHASEFDKKMFSDGWFSRSMPDMNQKNLLFADYLIVNTIWWIEYAGLAGIRMDTYPYPDKDFMTRWTCEVMDEYPNLNIVGEEWTDQPAIVSYWQAGKLNHDGYISCLPSLMDFPIQAALHNGLTESEDQWNSGMIKMYQMLALDFLYPDPYNLVIFPDNHDMDRIFTQVNEDPDLFKMAIAYIATMRGVPQLYYGTEILMENSDAPGDHGIIRTDFPGGWDGDQVNAFTGKGLTYEQQDAREYMRKILNWRKNSLAIHHGALMQFSPGEGIYVYFRYTDQDKVMVIMNKNKGQTRIDLMPFKEMLSGHEEGKDILTGVVFDLDERITVPGMAATILEIE